MRALLLIAWTATVALAQTPDSGKRPEFEVASIRPAEQDNSKHFDGDPSTLRIHNYTLEDLIAAAYDVDTREVVGIPKGMESASYDIRATIPEEFAKVKLSRMVQSLLADRFRLVIHREERQISGYALVVTKKGPKLKNATPDEPNHGMHTKDWHLVANGVDMEALAKYLPRYVDKMVIDKTGLIGKFNFELEWSPQRLDFKTDRPPDDRPSIFTALEQQLGLKLESARVPIEAIVVDRAEKPALDGN